MQIGKRELTDLLRAVFLKQHYIAFFNMIRIYPRFFNNFIKYFFKKGKYPYQIKINTPIGKISLKLYSYYDMLTVNEIFCRLDYKCEKNTKVVVDIGSNIGISALYFLTRNNYSKCYLYEPVLENINKIQKNLKNYFNRYKLEKVAISDEEGMKKFGTEMYGRCGGLNRESDSYISVNCEHINDILEKILAKEKRF